MKRKKTCVPCVAGHTSAAEDEEEDACPIGVGDATVPKDGMACWDGSELVIPHELKLEELI